MSEPAGEPGTGGQDPLAAFLASEDPLLDKIYGYIRRRLCDSDDVPGVFEETMKAFVAYADRKDLPVEEYLPVMFGIARRKIADAWRALSRRAAAELPQEPSDLALLADACVEAYGAVDLRLDVENALSRLTPKQRRVLVLRAVDQLTREETARAMGVSVSRVKALTEEARAKIFLHGSLKDYEPRTATRRRITQTGTSEAQA
ncbi:RNA polymerase sigma factor [Amycolatopsis sp. WGS_07]|uniref:RNA polymerase sigma factor n=1 Tax=Amycolatopsis sp. WGS_07 TaxID=3076764 RepID=UPI003872CE8F